MNSALQHRRRSTATVLAASFTMILASCSSTPDPDPVASPTETEVVEEKPTFANGVSEYWNLTGTDFAEDGALPGYLPRMMGPINVANRSDQPIQLSAGVLVHYGNEQAMGDAPTNWALLDAETGEPMWSEAGAGGPSSCATNDERTQAVCNTTFVQGSELIGFDEDGIRFQEETEYGAVEYVNDSIRVIAENSIEVFTADGEFVESLPQSGISGATVNNAVSPDCVWLPGVDGPLFSGINCDASEGDRVSTATNFNWSITPGENPVLLIDEFGHLSAYDAGDGAPLWDVPGALPGWFQDPQFIIDDAGERWVLVRHEQDSGDRYSVINLRSGASVEFDHTGVDRLVAVVGDEVLMFDGGKESSIDHVTVFNGLTGEEVYSGDTPNISDVAEVTGGPNGVLVGHYFCMDCTTAEGSHSIDSYTFLGPSDGSEPKQEPSEEPEDQPEEPKSPEEAINGRWCPTADSESTSYGCVTVDFPNAEYDEGDLGPFSIAEHDSPWPQDNGATTFSQIDAPFGDYYPAGLPIDLPDYYGGSDLPDQDRIWNGQSGVMLVREGEQ